MTNDDVKRRAALVDVVQEYGEPAWPENFVDEIPNLTNIRPYLLIERTYNGKDVAYSMHYSVKEVLRVAAAEIYEGCYYPEALVDLDRGTTQLLGITVDIMED